ncbi:flagellar filament capping protein FliD [Pseudogulbenkiania ferrooxidans]|uniref:Flagellar hook-associated protein 2 n=1 Tax=Pseudogulbenkiania ferrooxidans EGD-HP2 TaxID=1388764 RepID=A0ABN0N7E2_9NEIS|nr:flagellar filament capping protein FliD [Pseudogulbenkiania ferrooxidans]ERE07158.1 flagellar protein [Pseudogulbenkiania ferrooxidans EGD-HP2]
MSSISASAGPLDVQSIVSQLIQADSQPLTQSQQRVSNFQSELSTIGQVSSALSSLQSAASTLSSGTFLQQFSAASSDTTVAAVTTTSGGAAGTYALNVTQMAQSRQLVFDQTSGGASITDQNATLAGAPSSLTFNVGGTSSTVQLGSNASLSSIASSINGAGIGINASIVQYNNNYSLVLSSAQGGTSNSFSITSGGTDSNNTSGNTLAGLQQSSTAASESTNAQNALMTVNGVNVSSSSNTVTNVVNGASITLEKLGQTTINMSQNTSGIASTLQSFISAYNQVVSTTNSATTSSTTVGSTPANTDISSDLTGLHERLAGLLGTPVAGVDPVNSYAYLAQVGITQGADGTLSLNATAFNAALAANPSAVSNLFGNPQNTGIGNVFNSTINSLLGPGGMITSNQNNLNSKVTSEQQLQQQLQSQLSTEQTNLLTEYSSLNSELAAMEQSSSSMANLIG